MNSKEQLNKTLFDKINVKRVRPWKGEEEVRLAWISALEATLDKHFDAERAKKDSSYNNVIIEFKAPGFFKGSKGSAKFKEAIEDRLHPYIRKEAIKNKLEEDDFIGIAIDGEHLCFAQVKDGEILTGHLLEFSEYSCGLVIQAINSNIRKSITVGNLMYDFGHGSSNARELMQALSDALAFELESSENNKIKMLFQEWRTLYGQVADISSLHAAEINKETCFSWNGDLEYNLSGKLFVIHSYNSLLIKLLAAEIVSAHDLTSTKYPAQEMAAISSDEQLFNFLSNEIEKGGIFSQAGINGFIEEVIFSWYVDVGINSDCSDNISQAIRKVLATLSLYKTDKLSHSRDVLRDLYQALVPGRLRQSLGEFYTPDWLVDATVDKVNHGEWLNKRVLDPTCGSGAFLVSIIRKKKAEGVQKGSSDKQILKDICDNVWGFDLNPLAVQTARVNFVMEIAPLLRKSPGFSIEIPVLLADAIYSPASDPQDINGDVIYNIGSNYAGLNIKLPAKLAFDRKRLDMIFDYMGESVNGDLEYQVVQDGMIKSKRISEEEGSDWQAALSHTYNQVLSLHRKNWNGIWFRIVRNFFWSATAGKFEYIIGNPPWVRWSKLPDAYRERVKPTCEKYGIFSKNKRHGGNELDISAMITYTVADKWLQHDGRLGFVITGTLFKNPSSAGFRELKIADKSHLVPVEIDDLRALKPFSDAANHTVIAIFDKKEIQAKYPIPYRVWTKKIGFTRNIPVELQLDEVLERVDIRTLEAAPVEEVGSPWAVLEAGRFEILKKLSGKCSWTEGRKGVTVDLNGVYFVSVLEWTEDKLKIKSRPSAGKINIGPEKTAWVDKDIIYPLLKGAGDFEPCYLKIEQEEPEDNLYVLVPNRGISKKEYNLAEDLMNTEGLRTTKSWFSHYKYLLEARSTYRRQMSGAPYYAIYNIGEYSFKKWKVIWPEMAQNFYAAVASERDIPWLKENTYIPDHKVYFSSFDNKDVAYYLCGLLNTKSVVEWIESHVVNIQIGNIFKHLNLPEFDCLNNHHLELGKLAESIHQEHSKEKRQAMLERMSLLGESILLAWDKIS